MKIMEIAEKFTGSLTVQQCSNNDDKEFCSFYYKAIKRLLDINNKANVSNLHRYLKKFNEYYDYWGQVKSNLKDCEDSIINLLKNSQYYRFVFVYKNATLLSSAIAFHFRIIYKKSLSNINRLTNKKLVKICSLGGCSASDIVAIVTVLESIASKNSIDLDFQVTIIESDERWKKTCITILSCLRQFHEAEGKITFIHGNLSKKNAWTTETFKAIQEADIITMIRFLSKFNHKKKITQMICGNIQSRALLFILDRPLTELIQFSFGITDSEDFKLIHKELCDLHALDIEAVKYFDQLFQKQFEDLKQYSRINTSFNVFISVWMKAPPESVIKCQDNLERLFLNNVEKYNPKQSFLSSNAFTRWKNVFKIEKEAAGWSSKGIRNVVQKEKDKRNRLIVDCIHQKKKLDVLQKDLLNKLQLLKKEGEEAIETDEGSLANYLTQKRHYSLMKKSIYYSSFRSYK